jgi:indole-3-glycerol phosphate synthase
MSVLARICADKRDLMARRKRERPLAEVDTAARSAPSPRGFARRLRGAVDTGGYGLIAEIKRASPSKGLIRADFDPPALARAYAAGGATCLSVLTDAPYFQGDDAHLTAARAAVELPVLRKDFLLDPYQIVEARAIGADAVLVILAAVDDGCARELMATAAELGMDALVEVHDAPEIQRATALGAVLIGINNRNLATLEIDLATTERLAPMALGDRLLVSESGLYAPADLERMAEVGVRCFLVGEVLMREPVVEAATRALLAPAPPVTTP